MSSQVDCLKLCLANSYAFQLKAQYFHWNVTGPNFVQYHQFFGDLYSEVFAACDGLAEQIRTLDAFAPGSFGRFSEISQITDEVNIPDAAKMIAILYADNLIVLDSLNKCFEECGKNIACKGVENFIQDRIEIHNKHKWMLSSLKG